jgi:hypothetical protein
MTTYINRHTKIIHFQLIRYWSKRLQRESHRIRFRFFHLLTCSNLYKWDNSSQKWGKNAKYWLPYAFFWIFGRLKFPIELHGKESFTRCVHLRRLHDRVLPTTCDLVLNYFNRIIYFKYNTQISHLADTVSPWHSLNENRSSENDRYSKHFFISRAFNQTY